MQKKKVIFINNHFQHSDGTVRALIGIANSLDPEKFDVTIRSIYRCDKSLQSELRHGIKLEKTFGFYFPGFSKIVRKIPKSWLYKWCIGGKYDIEIAFQCDVPTLLVGNSCNKHAVHVCWVHGYEYYPNEHLQCDKVVCVSKYCADKLLADSEGRAKVTYRYNLVDDTIISSKAQQAVTFKNSQRPILISVGRLSPEKGYMRLLQIVSELRKEGYIFQLLIVGDGPEKESLRHFIQQHHLEDIVTMTGSDPNPHKYTAKSDLFICSSFSEGYSTACTEAAILGIPIITTAVPGGEEIILDCECGLLTENSDKSLKEGIQKVLACPDLIHQWKVVLQQTKNKFTFLERKRKMEALFAELSELSDRKSLL